MRSTALLAAFLAAPSIFAQGEPEWTTVSPSYYFTYHGSDKQPRLGLAGPYDFYFPGRFPPGQPLADQLGCYNNQYAPPFWYDGGRLMAGPRQVDTPAVGTVFATNQELRGVAFLGAFTPGPHAGVNGAVFYSDNPCYMGTLEYGFNRTYSPDSGYTQFYYSKYANCPASGPVLCHSGNNPSPETVVHDCSSGINLPGAYSPRTPDGHDPVMAKNPELYEAYVFIDPADRKHKFQVQVVDPATRARHWECVVDPSVPEPFRACPGGGYNQNSCGAGYPIASLYNARGAITATLNSNNGPLPTGQLAMRIDRILAAMAPPIPTLWVVGDSTANSSGGRGWADPFAEYFDQTKAHIVNRARGGRSSRTFLTEGLWEDVHRRLKPGDWVLIQFGHNDGGPPDQGRARGSLPGLGDESREFTLPNGARETVYTFGYYLRKFIAETRAAGANPVVLSPTVRNIWKDGAVERGPGQFQEWSEAIAKASGAPFADVTNAIASQYDRMGEAKVQAWFPGDHTHTSPEGADFNASMVVAALKGVDSPLAAWLSEKGRAVERYPRPVGLRLPEPRDPHLPSLFLIGDSTVRNGRGDGANGQWGWGEPLADRFDPAKVNVVNRAVGGLSSRTYLTMRHWERVLAMLKPGDVVLMQFGHNDGGRLDDPARARGTLPGAGEETQEIDNPITRQHEVVHTFGWYLRKFVADAKAKGAAPIVCSLVPRKTWQDGKIVRSSESYQKWAVDVAAETGVGFIDLNETVAAKYDALGPEKVDALFADERTHTTRTGAELNADSVLEGLKRLENNPAAGWLK